MKLQWLALARSIDIPEVAAEKIWRELAVAYGENGRFYHNLHHIQHALDVAEQLQAVAVDFTAVQLALWFHDVVYDPRRSDNEAQSAAFAERVLRPLGFPNERLETIKGLNQK